MEQTAVSPFPSQPKKSKKNIVIVIAVIVVLLLIAGSLYTLNSKSQQQEASISPTQEPTPSPTEKPEVDKTTVKIQVQNGTGTPGQAASAVKALTDAGYNADNIETANADQTNTSATNVRAKAGFEDTASDIVSTLKSTFPDATVNSTPLDSSSDFDIIVITGGKTFQTATPTTTKTTPTETPEASDTDTPTPSPTEAATPTP
jgi:hypothetical protein